MQITQKPKKKKIKEITKEAARLWYFYDNCEYAFTFEEFLEYIQKHEGYKIIDKV